MKKILSLTALMICLSLTAFANGNMAEKNIIHVTGISEMRLKSEIAVIESGLNIKKKSASEASKENARLMKNIRNIWTENGFDPNNIITTHYRLSPRTKYNKVKSRSEPDGFTVSHGLKFKIKNIERLGEAADLLTRNGITHIHNMRFEPKTSKDHYKELLKNAMLDAKSKAEVIVTSVGGTGLTLSNVHIQNGKHHTPAPQPVMMRTMDAMADSAPKTTIKTEGQIIRATVQTKWRFLP